MTSVELEDRLECPSSLDDRDRIHAVGVTLVPFAESGPGDWKLLPETKPGLHTDWAGWFDYPGGPLAAEVIDVPSVLEEEAMLVVVAGWVAAVSDMAVQLSEKYSGVPVPMLHLTPLHQFPQISAESNVVVPRPAHTPATYSARFCAVPLSCPPVASSPPLVVFDPPLPSIEATAASSRPHYAIEAGAEAAGPWGLWQISSPREEGASLPTGEGAACARNP